MDGFIMVVCFVVLIIVCNLIITKKKHAVIWLDDTIESCRETIAESKNEYAFYIGDVYRMSDDPFDNNMALVINVSEDGVYTQYVMVKKVDGKFEQVSSPHSASGFDLSESRFVTNLLND